MVGLSMSVLSIGSIADIFVGTISVRVEVHVVLVGIVKTIEMGGSFVCKHGGDVATANVDNNKNVQ